MTHRIPRAMLIAIATICAACIVLTVHGLTDRVIDAEARAQSPTIVETPPPDQARQLEALLDLFAFCREQANWDDPKCSTDPGTGGSIVDVLGNAPRDDDDDDTRVIVRTEDRDTPSPSTTTAPRPNPREVTPPSDDGGQPTGPGRGNGNGRGHGEGSDRNGPGRS